MSGTQSKRGRGVSHREPSAPNCLIFRRFFAEMPLTLVLTPGRARVSTAREYLWNGHEKKIPWLACCGRQVPGDLRSTKELCQWCQRPSSAG